jgi:hypothetical protein
MITLLAFVLYPSSGEEILPRPGCGERVGVRGLAGPATKDEGQGDQGCRR